MIPDRGGPDATFEVVTLDPPRALVHRSRRPRRGGPPMEISWALVLDPLDGDRCRLHLWLRIDRVGRRAPALVAAAADLVDGATVRPLFAGPAERVCTRRSTHARWSRATVSKWWVIGKASNARIRSSW